MAGQARAEDDTSFSGSAYEYPQLPQTVEAITLTATCTTRELSHTLAGRAEGARTQRPLITQQEGLAQRFSRPDPP